nr:gustatory receptor 30.1 [Papilio polytes]
MSVRNSVSNVFLFPSKYYRNRVSTTLILDNYIDAVLQKSLYPFNLFENILFLSKYSIRDNFITSNNRWAKFYSYFSTVLIIFVYILVISLDRGVRNFTPDFLVVGILHYILLIIGRILYNCTNNAFSDSHVNLIISIQRLQRSQILSYKSFNFHNWILFSVTCFYYVILFIIQTYAGRCTILVFLSYIILLIEDLNTLYLIRINKLLLDYVILFQTKLKTVMNFDVSSINSGRMREESLNILVKAFLEISNALSTYKHLSEIPMFYRTIFMAIYTLTYVELIILFQNIPDNMFWVLLLCWLIKSVCQVGMMCYNSESLNLMIKSIQATILVNITGDNSNAILEGLLHDCAVVYEKMTTSTILTVDASLPLTLLSVCATYTVVLLQFAFL